MKPSNFLLLFVLSAVCFGFIAPVSALGQDTASLVGTITDPSGAVVTGVSVTLVNKATGVQRVVSSNESGVYTAELLKIGDYKVTVSKPGFQTFVNDGIHLDAADRKSLDFSLKVGDVAEHVTVNSVGETVQTQSSDVSEVIGERRITELAVNGRNFLTLATLTTGVSNNLPDQPAVGVIGGMDGLNVSGLHGSYLRVTVDGAEDQNTGSYVQLTSYPALESLSEFKILANNYSAEYGGAAGGGQIIAITKSGTQDFHGSAYEFLRNDGLDARNYFAPTVTPLKYNNFGWTFGGPIFIPGKYNQSKTKDFFFFSQEWRRIRTSSQIRTRVPTSAELNGDFSNTLNAFNGQPLVLTDPQTGQPFANNQIPPQSINSNAQLLLGLWPTPNFVDPNNPFVNEFGQSSAPVNARQDTIRWDHNISEKQRIMARYTHDANTTTSVPTQWSPSTLPSISTVMDNPSRIMAFRYTNLINPNLLNEASFTWSRQIVDVGLVGSYQKPPGLTIQQLFPHNDANSLDQARTNKAPDVYVAGYANFSTGSFPWANNANALDFSDTVTKIWRQHSIKFGGLWLHNYRDESLMGTTQGAYTFTGQFSGDALADMLLGMPASYSETDVIPNGHWTFNQIEGFVQDDWKATRRLTLNLGLRYYYWGPLQERQNRMTGFDPSRFDQSQAATLDPTSGRIVTQPDPLNGLVLAGQNGAPKNLYGGSYLNNVSPRIGFAWDVTGSGKTAIRAGYGLGYYHPEGTFNLTSNPPYENTQTVNTPNFDDPSQGVPAPIFPPSLQVLQNYWSPRVAQWSVGIQRELTPTIVAKAAYVGTRGWRLPIRVDINQPGPVGGDQFDPAINAGTQALDSFRPFQGYGQILDAVDKARSDYRSLQLSLQKKFSGLQFDAGYTWSLARGIGGGRNGSTEAYSEQNARDVEGEYGPLAWDRRHVFIGDYVWELPFLRNRRGLMPTVLGGWEITGITMIQTGPPSTAGLVLPNSGLAKRATITGSISYPQKFKEWFDPSVLQRPAPGSFGESSLFSIYQPGMVNFNVSVFKNHHITERTNLQLRFEFFNVFNHTNWTNVDTNLGSPTVGTVQGARDPRIIQLGARLGF